MFKAGDKVRVLDTPATRADGYEGHFGLIGTVYLIEAEGTDEAVYRVRFWFPDTGVDYQSFYEHELELVAEGGDVQNP